MQEISFLVLDEDLDYLRLLKSQIRAKGHKCIGFTDNTKELLVKYKESIPNIIIIDPKIGTENPIENMKKIAPKVPNSALVVLAKDLHDDIEFKMEMNILGTLLCIEKPKGENVETHLDVIIDNIVKAFERKASLKTIHHVEQSPYSHCSQCENSSSSHTSLKGLKEEDKISSFERLKMISNSGKPQLLAIGASTGGPKSIHTVLSQLPHDFPLPIVICQHLPPNFSENLLETLQRGVSLKIVEGQTGLHLEPGVAILAPGGRHLEIRQTPMGGAFVHLSDEAAVNNCKPSVDVLFSSIATNFEPKVIAVILTGMGADGVEGLKELKNNKAHTIAESKETCVVFGMPMEAIKAGVIDSILPVDKIAEEIIKIISSFN